MAREDIYTMARALSRDMSVHVAELKETAPRLPQDCPSTPTTNTISLDASFLGHLEAVLGSLLISPARKVLTHCGIAGTNSVSLERARKDD